MLKCSCCQTRCAFRRCCSTFDVSRATARHLSTSSKPAHSLTSARSTSERYSSITIRRIHRRTGHDTLYSPWRLDGSRGYASIANHVSTLEPDQSDAGNAQVPVDRQNERWISSLDQLLPLPLRLRPDSPSSVPAGKLSEQAIAAKLASIILEARKESQFDLLAYVGIESQRWSAVQHVVRMLAEHTRPFHNPLILKKPFAFPYTNGGSLHQVSASPILLDPNSNLYRKSARPATVANTGQLRSDHRPVATPLPVIGSLWRTIGSLLIFSINAPPALAADTASNALRMLAVIDRYGHLPKDIATAKANRNNDPSAPQRPAWLAEYSSFLKTSSRFPPNPARWIEFALWSCLGAGHLMEATAILREIRRMQGPIKVTIGTSQSQSLEGIDQQPDSAASSTTCQISPDVVIAVIDGLITSLSTDHMHVNYTPFKVFERVAMLEALLRRDRMSLGSSTWEAAIARIADASNIDVEDNANFLAAALTLAPRYGREEQAPNAPAKTAPVNAATYVFDGCAALLGLYHRALHALVRHGAIGEALQTLLNLQKLIDRTKKDSLHDFFKAINTMQIDRDNLEPLDDGRIKLISGSPFTRVDHPGFHSHIPTKVLADLLDLVTDSKLYEIGRWMTMTNDIDGPLISEHLYGDPVMAPALIRYATAAHERRLLSVLVKAQAKDIQGETMLALCDVRIQSGDFASAVDVLNYVQEFCMHDWTSDDVCRLIKGLLLHIPTEETTTSPPVALLQRILRGDLYQIPRLDYIQLEVISAILHSMQPCPAVLEKICSDLLASDSSAKSRNLPTSSFNLLLDGIVRAYGSTCGRHIWETWFLSESGTDGISRAETSPETLTSQNRNSRLKTFSYNAVAKSEEVRPLSSVASGACITPDLATIRIIIRGALDEINDSQAAPLGSQTAVQGQAIDPAQRRTGPLRNAMLDWSADVLRGFGFSEDDIDYELHGYLSSFSLSLHVNQQADSPYSVRTCSLWRTFGSTARRIWVLARERELRSFASAAEGQQKLFSFPSMPPAEASLLMSLATDLGLSAKFDSSAVKTRADQDRWRYRGVRVMRLPGTVPLVPSQTVDDALRLQARRQRQLGAFREVLLESDETENEA